MISPNFSTAWKKKFGDVPPLGNVMREMLPENWIRVHSLPLSKRYADNEAEYSILLSRHNEILSDFLAEDEEYFLVMTGYSDTLAPEISYEYFKKIEIEFDFAFSSISEYSESEESPSYNHFFVKGSRWDRKSEDELLRLVADDEIANVMFVSRDCEFVYCPYGGGADIFSSALVRSRIRRDYGDWLP